MNTYRYTFIAACPSNGEQIIYVLELRHTQKVLVEHIKTACALHQQGYQEDIAADLHARFGGLLTLRAVHHGVDIETVLAAPAQAQDVQQEKLDSRIRDAGSTLANAAFNLSQQGGQVLEVRAARTLKKLQAEWDAAIAARAAQGGDKP